jgi:predicted XRE-type DNA-binding protein
MAKAKRAKAEQIEIEASGGNVFEDLGLPDASDLLVKAELARGIGNIVKDKNWTQRRAADVLGIAPPAVSNLMRGKLARFSQARLERFLNSENEPAAWADLTGKRRKPGSGRPRKRSFQLPPQLPRSRRIARIPR